MTYWRTARPAIGGQSTGRASHRAETPRDYINRYFPSDSLLAEPISPPFEGSKFAQACRDIFAVFGALLFILATGFAIAFSLFALFFLRF